MNRMSQSPTRATLRTRHALLAALTMVLCGAITACGDDDSQPTDVLSVYAQVSNMRGQIGVVVEQPGRKTSNLTHADFLNAPSTSIYRVNIPTSKAGVLRTSFAVVGTANDTISNGKLELALTNGYVYGISISRERAKSGNICFGCSGVLKFPIRDTQSPTTDSIWVFYSAGPPLCKGCVI